MTTQDGGLAAVAYAPSSVKTTIGKTTISVNLDTEYPFDETLTFIVNSNGAFPFYLRIPEWADGATIRIGTSNTSVPAGKFAQVSISAGNTQVVLNLPMKFRLSRGINNYASVNRGPLLYALQ